MLKSSLIQLLRSFSKKEMSRFVKYVDSPYFNVHQDIIRLIAYLESIYPHFNEKNCDRNLIFKKTKPKATFNLSKLKHLFSFTISLAEEFLIIERIQERKNLSQLLLLRQLSNKKLDNRFQRQLKKFQKNREKIEERDTNFFYHEYVLSNLINDHLYIQTNRYEDDYLGKIDQNLDIFYLSEKLKNACQILSRNQTFQSTVKYPLINDLLQYIEHNRSYFEDQPQVLLYFQLHQILSGTEEDSAFKELISDLEKRAHEFSVAEQHSFFGFCTSYCIKQINLGKSDYLNRLFSLYKLMLNLGLLLEGGHISEWRYKNLVTVGTRLKEYEWTENFIEDYKDQLQKKVRENAYTYNLASYYFAVNKMDEALQILNSVKYTDLVYVLGSRTLLLKIYYETKEEEAMTYQIDAFLSFLKRNRSVSEPGKKRYTNLLKYLKKLGRIRANIKLKREQGILDDLDDILLAVQSQRSQVTNAPWVISKIEELQAKLKK